MDMDCNTNVYGDYYSINDLEPLCSTMSQHVNNALSVESGFMENNWQDNQKIQMQNQVNIWNSMMYRYWKLQSQQHLIPHYRNAWLRRMSYEVNPASHSDTNDVQASHTNTVQSHTLDPSHTFASTLKSTEESLNTKNPKRIRTSFTEEQIRILEKAFLSNSCLSPGSRRYLAKQLGLSERRVNVWFQNRRVKKHGNSRMDYWIQYYIPENAALCEYVDGDTQYLLYMGSWLFPVKKTIVLLIWFTVTLTGNTHLHNITPYYTA